MVAFFVLHRKGKMLIVSVNSIGIPDWPELDGGEGIYCHSCSGKAFRLKMRWVEWFEETADPSKTVLADFVKRCPLLETLQDFDILEENKSELYPSITAHRTDIVFNNEHYGLLVKRWLANKTIPVPPLAFPITYKEMIGFAYFDQNGWTICFVNPTENISLLQGEEIQFVEWIPQTKTGYHVHGHPLGVLKYVGSAEDRFEYDILTLVKPPIISERG